MNAAWLKSQFALNPGRTKADLARALGLEAPAVSKILSGSRRIKAEEYVAMRRFFGLPVDGSRAAGSAGEFVIAPLAPGLGESAGADAPEDGGEWVMPASLISRHVDAPPEKIRIFTVEENAMQPDFAEGEPVLVNLADRDPARHGYFLVSDGFSYAVRHCAYVPHSQPPLLRISARAAHIAPYEIAAGKAELVGRVVAKLQWL